MRRLSRGCCSESHPLCEMFMLQLFLWSFELDESDLKLLQSAKGFTMYMLQQGIPNPSQSAVNRALSREELTRHCRRRIRGAQQTTELIEDLLLSLSPATNSLLFKEEMKDIWSEQKWRKSLLIYHSMLLPILGREV